MSDKRPPTRRENREKRVRAAKRQRATHTENLSDRGLTVKTKHRRSETSIHVPRKSIPDNIYQQMLERDIVNEQGELEKVLLSGSKESQFETEWYVSGQAFTIVFSSNSTCRRAFRRFCEAEGIYFANVPKALQPSIFDAEGNRHKNVPPQGRCAITDIITDDARLDEGKQVNMGTVRSDGKEIPVSNAVSFAVSFYGISDEMRQRLMVRTWVRRTYLIRLPQPAQSSASHRIGERLKQMKLYDYEKSAHKLQWNQLCATFEKPSGKYTYSRSDFTK